MANKTYPTSDRLEYIIPVRQPAHFDDLFDYKKIRDGVFVLTTQSYEHCHREFGFDHDIYFGINPVKGKKLDKNNKIVCDGDVNVLNIFDSHSKVVLRWRPRCILTLLVPIGSSVEYEEAILEFNYNEEEINDYLREQQIEKIKEEIKATELKKALRQIARQRLVEEGILFDEDHKRPYIPQEVVGFVFMRDGGRCCKCGRTKDLELDHIIPFSKGGSSEPENLQLLCRECNLKKSNKF